MDAFLAGCPRCGAPVRPPVRAGPSGSFRLGGTPAWCGGCRGPVRVASRDALDAARIAEGLTLLDRGPFRLA